MGVEDIVPPRGVKTETPPPSLRRNFSWALLGNLVFSGSQWLIIVILVKLGSPATVGRYAVGLAITAPVILLANLSLNGLQITDARREFSFAEYFGLRLISTGSALLVIIGIVIGGGYRFETALVTCFLGIAKAFDAVSDVFIGFLQLRERMDLVARIYVVNGVVSLLAIYVAMATTHSVVVAAFASAIGSLVALAIFAIPSATLVHKAELLRDHMGGAAIALLRPAFQLSRLRILMWRAAPLGVVGMLLSLSSSIPQVILHKLQGSHQVGIFAALASLMVAGRTISGAIAQSASPRLAVYSSAGRVADFQRLLRKMLMIAASLGAAGLIIAVFLGRPLLTLFFSPEYATYQNIFVWMMASMALSYFLSFTGVAVTSMQMFRPQLPVHIINVFIIAILCWVLIPRYGIAGAAWAVFVSTAVMTAGYAALTNIGIRKIVVPDHEKLH